MRKTEIVDRLGEAALLLPSAVAEALRANDRVKAIFSLLQGLAAKASGGDARFASNLLHAEDSDLRGLLDGGSRSNGGFRVAGLPAARERIRGCLLAMIEPVRLAYDAEVSGEYVTRMNRLEGALPDPAAQEVPADFFDRMTCALGRADSHHRLVMDLHKRINGIQREIAVESLAGASAYGLREDDKPLVKAFMAGIERTSPLRFGHPGLETTATRSGDDVLIQNDVGTTGAHVFVVHVRGPLVTLTYTDVHRRRARFFQDQLRRYPVVWEEARTGRAKGIADGEERYVLCSGRFEGADQDQVLEFLTFLASRLVFLIDWNKARKRLRAFVGNAEAVELLHWAADHEFGHRAFLALGGDRIVFDAIEYASRGNARIGERLDEVLGRQDTVDYLRAVLRISSAGLREGRSTKLVADEVKSCLLQYFQTVEQTFVGLALQHAGVTVDLADSVRGMLAALPPCDSEEFQRWAERARRWERRADTYVGELRRARERNEEAAPYVDLLRRADDAVDALEEVVFHLSLVPQLPAFQRAAPHLPGLAELVVRAAQELTKALEAAFHVHRRGVREDVEDMLQAIDALVAIEHESDEVHRRTVVALVRDVEAPRAFWLGTEIAGLLEQAVDALMHAGHLLRDRVMGEVILR